LFKLIKEDTGKDHPALSNKPALRSDCIKYHDAFCFLGASRLWSQVGPNPIQVSEVESMLRMMGIESSETQLKYLRLIQRMDRVEMKHLSEQMKAARKT